MDKTEKDENVNDEVNGKEETNGKEESNGKEEETEASIEELQQEADELMKEQDYASASEVFSLILEKKVIKYGDLADECADSYFDYGKCLLKQARAEVDVLGGRIRAKAGMAQSNEPVDPLDSDSDEELDPAAALQESADCMEIAWESVEAARVIYAKNPERKLQLAEVHQYLGDLNMESDNMAQALDEFEQCLKIREAVLPNDDTKLADVHYSIGLALDCMKDTKRALEHYEMTKKILESKISNSTDAELLKEWKEIVAELEVKIDEFKTGAKLPAQKTASSTSTFDKPTLQNANGHVTQLGVKKVQKKPNSGPVGAEIGENLKRKNEEINGQVEKRVRT